MSNVAQIFAQPLAESAERPTLGPARFLEMVDFKAKVRLADGKEVVADMAMALPYAPTEGDSLLVIGIDRHYVIGVLDGKGKTELTFQGDVDLKSIGGTLHLSGEKGVKVTGAELDIVVGKLKSMATSAVEKFDSLYQRVTGVISTRARETHTIVDEGTVAKSKSATILTDETMTINGKQIHLG